jgi:hypothetical protein
VIEAQPVGDAAAAIVSRYHKSRKSQLLHDFDLIECHRAKEIVYVVVTAIRLLESPYPRKSGSTTVYFSASLDAILCQVT